MSYEVQMIGGRESKASEKKSMALNALTDGSDSNSDKLGHFNRDRPYPDRQNPPMNNEPAKKRKRAFTATLDDSDSSSSDDDQKTDNSNMCFTAVHDSNKFTKMDSEKDTRLQYIG